MPRVTLTFDLPREETEFRDAIDGAEATSVLRAVDDLCRRLLKDTDTAYLSRHILEQIREMIPQEFSE